MHISQDIYIKNHISRGGSFPFSVGNKGIPLCPFSVGPFYHRLCYSWVPLFYGVSHWAPDGEVLLREDIWPGSSTSGGVWVCRGSYVFAEGGGEWPLSAFFVDVEGGGCLIWSGPSLLKCCLRESSPLRDSNGFSNGAATLQDPSNWTRGAVWDKNKDTFNTSWRRRT